MNEIAKRMFARDLAKAVAANDARKAENAAARASMQANKELCAELLQGALDTLWEWHQEALNFEAPVVKPAPILTPCVCDIRNLMSTGHDAGCAHKGGKR